MRDFSEIMEEFVRLSLQRLEEGLIEHDNSWEVWDRSRFIREAKEEIVDCFNYMRECSQKHDIQSDIFAKLKLIYAELDRLATQEKD